MYVKRLKEILQHAIDQLDRFPDDYEVDTLCNDYRVDPPVLRLHSGFVQLDEIEASPEEEG